MARAHQGHVNGECLCAKVGLLGLNLNEYELDLLRQCSVKARHEKASKGDVITAPLNYDKAEDQRLEKNPDRLSANRSLRPREAN